MKHNDVFLYGQVLANPRIVKDDNGQYIRGVCPILVIRGVRNYGSREIDHINYDKPTIISGNATQIEKMATWRKGDMVEVKGAITTKDVNKVSTCKHENCKCKNSNPGVIVFVNPIYTKVIEKGLTSDQGIALLKESCEISNQVRLVGMLCREPACFMNESKHMKITNYQLAVNRKFHILEDAEDNRVDFPWIKSYGKIASDDFKFLKKGAYVLIDGMIQTRDITRKQVCSACGQPYEFNETVIDVIPYSTEHLRGQRTEEEIAEEEKKLQAEAIKSVFGESEIIRPTDTPEIPPELLALMSKK